MQEIEVGEEVIALEVAWEEDSKFAGVTGILLHLETVRTWATIKVAGKESVLPVKKYTRPTDLLKELF